MTIKRRSREEDEDIEEVLEELRSYVDMRLSQFREELMEFLGSSGGRDRGKLRTELLGVLGREVERLRGELMSELMRDNEALRGELESIKAKLEMMRQQSTIQQIQQQLEVIKQAIQHQQNDEIRRLEERLVIVIKEIITKEINAREVKGISKRRKKMLWLLGGLAAIAAVIAVAALWYPWIWVALALILLFWLRR